jgi:hypothetical protein
MICAFVHGLSNYFYFWRVKGGADLITSENKNPVDYLNLFFTLASVWYHFAFTFAVWTKAEHFVGIINYLAGSRGTKSVQNVTNQDNIHHHLNQNPNFIHIQLLLHYSFRTSTSAIRLGTNGSSGLDATYTFSLDFFLLHSE